MVKRPHIYIGKNDFREMITKGVYYVDKTDLIKELILGDSAVTLFTRPRRFGKTLALEMLSEFFDITKKETNAHLFDGLKIAKDAEFCKEHQNAYPVISMSFKDTRQPNFETSYKELAQVIRGLSAYIKNLTNKVDLENGEIEILERIKSDQYDATDLAKYPLIVTKILYLYYGKKVVVLLDEYDVPIQSAFLNGYYEKMLPIISTAMSKLFKDSKFIEIGVITGCLRIAKESIFTGMNNFSVNSVLTENVPEHFGFTPVETEKVLIDCGLDNKIETVRHWYDGYRFGHNDVYNPWSVLNFAAKAMVNPRNAAQTYWMNTSRNDILLYLVERVEQNSAVRQEIEDLLDGKPVKKKIVESTVFGDLNFKSESIWSVLLFTGYLKPVSLPEGNVIGKEIEMILPNEEVKEILIEKIDEWFSGRKENYTSCLLAESIFNGDTETAENEISQFLQASVSVRDEKEDFYHGVLLALLHPKWKEYHLISNKESGNGYFDIAIKHYARKLGVVIEIKKGITPKYRPGERIDEYYPRQIKALTDALDKAENQLRSRNYTQMFLQDGCKLCLCYAAAFVGKECRLRKIEI